MLALCLVFALGLAPGPLVRAQGVGDDDYIPVARPRLPLGPITLHVAHAVNPRIDRFAPRELTLMLAETRRIVRQHFALDLRFWPAQERALADVFALLPEPIVPLRAPLVHDFVRGDRERLRARVETDLRSDKGGIERLAAYAAPHLLAKPADAGAAALAEAVTATFVERFRQLAAIKARDGRPLLDGSRLQEWTWWDTLGYGELPWDLVVTNQLIASAEYDAAPIHTAIRGGITAGTTTYSRRGRFGAFVFWSTYLFTSADPVIVTLRGGERYGREEAARLAGAYLAHEIGHLLLHLGHPFGNRACVMNPVELLRFRAWYHALDAARCRIGSEPAMQPGAGEFHVNRAWLERLP